MHLQVPQGYVAYCAHREIRNPRLIKPAPVVPLLPRPTVFTWFGIALIEAVISFHILANVEITGRELANFTAHIIEHLAI
jgi:hypothetical protein